MPYLFCNNYEEINSKYPPCLKPLYIKKSLIGVTFIANGEGPHKTIILLHGFPGNEKNYDIAHMLRRVGFNVVIFHYSGSWGSKGTYSFSQAYLDIATVREVITQPKNLLKYRIDESNIFLIGHSVGGFFTLLAAKENMPFKGFGAMAPFNLSKLAYIIEKNIILYKETLCMFDESIYPLNGTDSLSLIEEIVRMKKAWSISENITNYEGKKMLLIIASKDDVAIPSVHQDPIADMLKKSNTRKTIVSLPCDHNFSECRPKLVQILWDWLKS